MAIEGYPSTISVLAGYLNKRNLKFPLKAAFTSSETLLPNQRQAIERAFECKLFDFYGMAERVVFATECGLHSGKHLNVDFAVTEILSKNNEPASQGQIGRIVATGLHNWAMPLIRYQTSDVTVSKAILCQCGRRFPLIADITTKDDDIVTTPDGRYISSSILNAVTHNFTTIEEHQIVQEDRSHLVMKIVKSPTYTESDSALLKKYLQEVMGSEMQIDLEFVSSIPRTNTGKFRWVISKVPLEF
jgi:phenylacetate-CoA ligase